MNEYEYRNYVIVETPDGYYQVGEYEFPSYEEACDLIDDLLDTSEPDENSSMLKTFHIFYVTKSYRQGYDEFVEAYSEEEAIQKLKRKYKDIAYIADCYEIG